MQSDAEVVMPSGARTANSGLKSVHWKWQSRSTLLLVQVGNGRRLSIKKKRNGRTSTIVNGPSTYTRFEHMNNHKYAGESKLVTRE